MVLPVDKFMRLNLRPRGRHGDNEQAPRDPPSYQTGERGKYFGRTPRAKVTRRARRRLS